MSIKPSYWHYCVGAVLLAALVPMLRSQGLPLQFDWSTLAVAYWLVLAAQSIFVAALLAIVGLPARTTYQPWMQRYRESPVRIFLALTYFGLLLRATTWAKALVLTVDTIALLELHDRSKENLRRSINCVIPPAAYLFFGFIMVLAYNCAIVSMRNPLGSDPGLASIDRWLLAGHSVSDFSHWAAAHLPGSIFRAAEFTYFGMFPQIGASMILLALGQGRSRALQFVGTILTAYYVALLMFFIWPAQGPYSQCAHQFSRFPADLKSWHIQKTLMARAIALYHHEPIRRISTDYFIALPSMHIAQPLVVLWYLRQWRRIVFVLAVYDVFLTAAILVLEMHYVVDLLAGILVAALAVVICDWAGTRQRVAESAK